MAGDWIKMRSNLWDDPRVGALVDSTDSSEAAVVGGLYWLWATADQHSEDGTMPGLTLRGIDRKTGIAGFAQALVDIGWIADHPEGISIIKFEEHNGASAKKRCQTASRVAKHASNNAKVTTDVDSTNAPSVSDALAREREREREEEREESKSPAGDSAKVSDLCPHAAIVDLYHDTLPTARRIRDWTPARQQALRARWREKAERQSLEWWAKFFGYVGKSDFLCGRAPVSSGRKPFELSLDWLCKSENFIKVLEGAYES